jgi:Xaa-Pro dipeptidase
MNLDWHADRSDLSELTTLDQLAAGEPIDLAAVRSYRLGRVREQMAAHALDACVLLDPVNVRYATGARNMQVFHSRNPARYLFVPQSGPVILHEFAGRRRARDDRRGPPGDHGQLRRRRRRD